jgi:MFS transporter, NNP family, nitrate/nitrite transporter
MMLSGLFIKMSNGATYVVVPFVNRKALGAVAGIVGAGGNVGCVFRFVNPEHLYRTARGPAM